jgi:hypothetical protein
MQNWAATSHLRLSLSVRVGDGRQQELGHASCLAVREVHLVFPEVKLQERLTSRDDDVRAR